MIFDISFWHQFTTKHTGLGAMITPVSGAGAPDTAVTTASRLCPGTVTLTRGPVVAERKAIGCPAAITAVLAQLRS